MGTVIGVIGEALKDGALINGAELEERRSIVIK